MPIIQCDIRRGRTPEQLDMLASGITDAVMRHTGIPLDYMFVVVRQHPGASFIEAGVPVPDYTPGPDGKDIAGMEWEARRAARDGLD
jgi:phenylpyruvate tautomerase PptA (4-oxalocrotonate tautomerase family)